MKTCLQIAGVLQIALSLAHFDFARRFGWHEELQRVSLLTRQIFWVHTGFLMLVLAGFGGVSLLCADDLLMHSPLARAVLGGLSVFWIARWYCQFFVYRPELWRGNSLNTLAHILFAALWTFLAGVYITAFCHQF
ncbi:MAG: hypothetical protein HZA89_13890 [Verrucomicrobia bacterium]|nr:hypothetical protein [Verrucomicrobiota bacterium]